MKVFQVFFIISSCFFAMDVYSYKEFTHQDLSENAVLLSDVSIDQTLLTSFGLQDFSSNEIFINPDNVSGKKNSIIELVRNGADFEDRHPRFLNHFFDPINNRPLTVIGAELGFRSPDWAIEDNGDVTSTLAGAQEYSYKEAMSYFYKALTSQTKETRELNWGKTFQTLGQVIHHIQDMAQPDHVRNDQHNDVTDSSWYEEYTNIHKGEAYFTSLMNGNAYPIPTFPTAREFWTTRADHPVQARQGLADFTNRNFVSKDTNFYVDGISGDFTTYGYSLPVPQQTINKESLVTLMGGQGQAVCDNLKTSNSDISFPTTGCFLDFVSTTVTDTYPGAPQSVSTNTRASTYSLFNKKFEDYGLNAVIDWGEGDVTVDRVFSLNEFNFKAAHGYLIPRAVAYSAGLINHFFRGKIDMIPNPAGDGWVIQNQSDQEMQGTFTLYYDDINNVRKSIPGAVWGTEVYGINDMIASSNEMVVPDYIFPSDVESMDFILVFQGRIGQEGNTVLTDNDYVIASKIIHMEEKIWKSSQTIIVETPVVYLCDIQNNCDNYSYMPYSERLKVIWYAYVVGNKILNKWMTIEKRVRDTSHSGAATEAIYTININNFRKFIPSWNSTEISAPFYDPTLTDSQLTGINGFYNSTLPFGNALYDNYLGEFDKNIHHTYEFTGSGTAIDHCSFHGGGMQHYVWYPMRINVPVDVDQNVFPGSYNHNFVNSSVETCTLKSINTTLSWDKVEFRIK